MSQGPTAPDPHTAGSDPRWPGPPSTWPGEPGASESPPGSAGQGGPPAGGYGPAGTPPLDGPPPPPWKRRRRRWLLGLAIGAAIVLLAIPVGFGLAALSRAASDISLTSDDEVAGGGGEDEAPTPREDVEVVAPDLEDLDGVDAVVAQVMIDIDRSEQIMMDTQQRFADVFAEPSTGGDPGAALDELSAAAGRGQLELQELRSDLTAPIDGSEVRAVRDRYLAHLDAWVRYLVAVEEDPTLLAGGGGEEAFLLAIDTTGEAFAREVRGGLPDGLDEDVRDYALAIVERGFPEGQPDAGDTV